MMSGKSCTIFDTLSVPSFAFMRDPVSVEGTLRPARTMVAWKWKGHPEVSSSDFSF